MISMIALTNIPVCVITVHGVVVTLSRQKIQVRGVSAFMKKTLLSSHRHRVAMSSLLCAERASRRGVVVKVTSGCVAGCVVE